MNRHCIPGLTMSVIALTGNFQECPGIIKTMHTGFSAYTYCTAPTPGADTEETGRYDLAWKDLCSVLNASVNSNELSKGIVIPLCSWIFVTHRKTPALARFSPCIAEM